MFKPFPEHQVCTDCHLHGFLCLQVDKDTMEMLKSIGMDRIPGVNVPQVCPVPVSLRQCIVLSAVRLDTGEQCYEVCC